MESRASPFSELLLYLTSLSGSLPLALFVFIAESMCIGRSAGVPGGADERVRVVEELEVEVGRFQGLFRPFLAGAGERDKAFVVDLLLFVSKISSRRRPTCQSHRCSSAGRSSSWQVRMAASVPNSSDLQF
jgi:hypothetical protein